MISNILLFWLLGSVLISLYDLKIGISSIIVYLLLVPYSSFTDALIPIEYNYIIFLIFAIFVYKESANIKKMKSYTLLKIFILFSLTIFLGSLFTELAFKIKAVSLYRMAINNFIIPVMLWQLIKNEVDVNYFIRIITGCFFVMALYGLYCFYTQSNPYVTVLSILFNKASNFDSFANTERGGFEGRVQSTTFHPFFWSASLVMMTFFAYVTLKGKNVIVYYSMLSLIIVNLFITGVRTGIIAFFLSVIFFFMRTLKIGRFVLLFSVVFLISQIIDTSIFGKYQEFAESIIYIYNPDKKIAGSSIDMRLSQLSGALEMWANGNSLFGYGYGWCDNYFATKGVHPVLLVFESIFYKVIIDSGLVGILAWGWLFMKLHKLKNMIAGINETGKKIYSAFILSYVLFCLATGIFGLNIFLILLVLLYKYFELFPQESSFQMT